MHDMHISQCSRSEARGIRVGLIRTMGIGFNALPVTPAGESQEEAASSGRKAEELGQSRRRWPALEFRIPFFSKRILYADSFSFFCDRSRRSSRDAGLGAADDPRTTPVSG